MTSFALKTVACVAMLIDHFGAFALQRISPELGSILYIYFRAVGRMAFPIFAYFIALGCKKTKNIKKYMLRLGILAIISEVFFDMVLINGNLLWDGIFAPNINFFSQTNIFYTLFLSVVAIAIYQYFKQNIGKIAVVLVLPILLLADILGTDYGSFGIALILAIYITNPENKLHYSLVITLSMLLLYTVGSYVSFNIWLLFILFSMLSVVLLYFYNGKQGPNGTLVKWSFYLFYPLHLLALMLLPLNQTLDNLCLVFDVEVMFTIINFF